MSMARYRLSILAVACALSACSAIKPSTLETDKPTTAAAVTEKMSNQWNEAPITKEGKNSTVLLMPLSIPREIRSKPVTLELEAGATVTDVVAALAKLGHSVILADKEAGAKSFYLPRYEGTLGGLLSAVTRVTDVWFTWHDGAILVSPKERFALSMAQEEGLATLLEKELKNFGIDASAISSNAGLVTFEATPSQLRRVKGYLERVTANAAIVTLQLAVVNVSMNQNAKQGIDWEGLSYAVGPLAAQAQTDILKYRSQQLNQQNTTALTPTTSTGTNTSTGTGTGTGTNTGSTTDSSAISTLAAASTSMLMAGGALQGLIATGKFSFSAMFNFLDKYGTAETSQNTVFKTVTGQEVVFKSVTEIPYVSEIGAVANQTTTQGSAKTDKAKDGIELNMTPTFDASANTVSIKLKLSLKAVLAFNELSAGNQLGKLTQPTTADRTFNDIIRLRPGQTAVVGGIVYDSITDNRALPLFLQKGSSLESQALKVDRQVMFIVVRPAITRLGDLGETEADSLDFNPNGVLDAPPAPAAKKATASKKLAKGKAAPASKADAAPATAGDYEELKLQEPGV